MQLNCGDPNPGFGSPHYGILEQFLEELAAAPDCMPPADEESATSDESAESDSGSDHDAADAGILSGWLGWLSG